MAFDTLSTHIPGFSDHPSPELEKGPTPPKNPRRKKSLLGQRFDVLTPLYVDREAIIQEAEKMRNEEADTELTTEVQRLEAESDKLSDAFFDKKFNYIDLIGKYAKLVDTAHKLASGEYSDVTDSKKSAKNIEQMLHALSEIQRVTEERNKLKEALINFDHIRRVIKKLEQDAATDNTREKQQNTVAEYKLQIKLSAELEKAAKKFVDTEPEKRQQVDNALRAELLTLKKQYTDAKLDYLKKRKEMLDRKIKKAGGTKKTEDIVELDNIEQEMRLLESDKDEARQDTTLGLGIRLNNNGAKERTARKRKKTTGRFKTTGMHTPPDEMDAVEAMEQTQEITPADNRAIEKYLREHDETVGADTMQIPNQTIVAELHRRGYDDGLGQSNTLAA